jgi:hypothetical protein
MGSNPQDFTEQVQSRKTVQLEGDKIFIIYLKWNAQGRAMILIEFLSYRYHSVWETGFRIGSRTIKRGSRVSNLIVSIWRELKPLHTWNHLFWILFGFYPCDVLELVVISMTSSSSSNCVFGVESFTGSSL